MVRQVYEAMRMEAAGRGHALELDLQEPGSMLGDVERLEQVLTNVVSNSIKYTPEGGRIRIQARRDQDEVVISVEDNGIGIPEKDLERIFDRFYRVDKARSREMGGTGLGLAIAQEIMEAHRGKISIASKLGVGTTVTLRLPSEMQVPAIKD
jgi:two-component system sensor histidine kinase VicK